MPQLLAYDTYYTYSNDLLNKYNILIYNTFIEEKFLYKFLLFYNFI